MYRLLVFFLFFPGFLPSQPSLVIDETGKSVYNLVTSLRFQEAEKILQKENESIANNQFYNYIANYHDYLACFISEDDSLFSVLKKNKNSRIDQLEKIPSSNPYKLYIAANINLQWAIARLKFGEYYTAAVEFNRAYRTINENIEKFPSFLPNQITLGVVHAVIGIVPDSYQWLLQLINMSGTVEQGRNELIEAFNACENSNEFSYLQNEILFYLSFIDLNLYTNPQQTSFRLDQLQRTDPNNLLMKYLTINILMKSGQNNTALITFATINDSIEYFPFAYLSYLKGECLIRQLHYKEAQGFYNYFSIHFKGKNYLKDAQRKQAWCALLLGDTVGYYRFIKGVKNIGNMEIGIDKEAENEFESTALPQDNLLRSRLLFDGGYYSKAEKELNQLPQYLKTQAIQIEKNYRQARIYQKTDRINQAKMSYIRTIEIGKESESYFAANSALMLGEIYETEGQIEAAMSMYQLCLELNFITYRNSIRGKAKQQLNRLKKSG